MRIGKGRSVGVYAMLLGCLAILSTCDTKSSLGVEESLSVISELTLIDGAENATIRVNKGTESYFSLDLTNIIPNKHILNGPRKGWCIVWNKPINSNDATHKGLRLYSTYQDQNWKPINYLLNIRAYLEANDPDITNREIQVAIWSLLDFPEFDLSRISVDQLPSDMVTDGHYDFDVQKVTQIVTHVVQNYSSFQYNLATTHAVIAETPTDTQTIIIEVGESVWAFGQYSFRSQQLRNLLGINTTGMGQWGWIYEMETDYAYTELIAGGGDDDGTKSADEVGTIIGSLEMMKGNDQLEINYSTFSGYLINDLHLWVGCSLDDFPGVGQAGNVAPGQLPYSYDDAPTDSHTFRISLSELSCDDSHFIAAHAGELYQVKEVDLPGELVFTMFDLSNLGLNEAIDINDHGDILSRNIYWNNNAGTIINVPLPSRAIKINNNREVISNFHYWKEETGVIEIDTLSHDQEGARSSSIVYDINNNGFVVGEVDSYLFIEDATLDYDFFHMVWHKEHGLTASFLSHSTAFAISNSGRITGVVYSHGFIYLTDDIDGSMKEIIFFEADEYGRPFAVNDNGSVVGSISVIGSIFETDENGNLSMTRRNQYDFEDIGHQNQFIDLAGGDQDQSEAFYWNEVTGRQNLGTLGGESSIAFDINDHGQVVGYSDIGIGNGEHRAFYWDEQNGMLELPTFGGNSIARAINNHGQIVGESYDDNGNLIPVMWEVSFEPKWLVFSRGY